MLTLQELKETIAEEVKKNKFPYEEAMSKIPEFTPNGECFEAIDMGKSKDFFLMPEEEQETFLFRGQSQEYDTCYPSIYRGEPSALDIFVNRMRLVQFEHLLLSHSAISGFFKKHHFKVDVEGLAQHYGIKTSVLDLTSSLNVALFFAMCPYDSKKNIYTCYNDNQQHTAVLYVLNRAFDNEPSPNIYPETMFQKIRPIGLQAFDRPGMQRGFALHLNPEESIKGYIYRFSFTSEDSKQYLDYYHNGEKLWINDELVEKAQIIAKQTEFSFKLFGETFDKFRPTGFSRRQLKKKLFDVGIKLDKNSHDTLFSEDEKNLITNNWNEKKAKFLSEHILRRKWYEYESITNSKGEKVDKLSGSYSYRTPQLFMRLMLMKVIAFHDPPKNAEWVNYQGTGNMRKVPKKYQTNVAQKIPATRFEPKGKPWLTEEECRI